MKEANKPTIDKPFFICALKKFIVSSHLFVFSFTIKSSISIRQKGRFVKDWYLYPLMS